ncbi:MAG: hypothetical protein IJI43_02655 [Bacilli bacterium]|nr:hypothetical protein [Bacilli bacterium]
MENENPNTEPVEETPTVSEPVQNTEELNSTNTEVVPEEKPEVIEPVEETPTVSEPVQNTEEEKPADTTPAVSEEQPVMENPAPVSENATPTMEEVKPETAPLEANAGTQPASADNKKSSKKLIGVIVVAILLLVALGAFLLPRMFVNKKAVVERQITEVFSGIRNNIEESKKSVLDYNLDKDTLGVDGVLTIDSDYKTSEIDLTKLKDYEINYSAVIDKKENQASAKFSLTKKAADILSLDAYIKDKEVLVSLKDIYDKVLKTDTDTEIKDFDFDKNQNYKDILLILDKTEKIVIDNIDDKDITKSNEKKKIEDKEEKLTKIEYKVDMKNLSKKIAEEFSKDDKIIDALARLTGSEKSEVKEGLESYLKDDDSDEFDKEDIVESKIDSNLTLNIYLKGLVKKAREVEVIESTDKLVIDIDKEIYKYSVFSDTTKLFNGEYNTKDRELTLKSEDGMDLKIKAEKNTTTFELNYKEDNQSIKVNAIIDNKLTKSKQDINMKMDFDYNSGSEKIKAAITNNMTLEKNKTVEVIDGSKAVDADSISEADQTKITEKLQKKLQEVIKDIMPSGDMASFRKVL